jgi:hypothetical protein
MAVTLPDGTMMGNVNAAPSANAGAGPATEPWWADALLKRPMAFGRETCRDRVAARIDSFGWRSRRAGRPAGGDELRGKSQLLLPGYGRAADPAGERARILRSTGQSVGGGEDRGAAELARTCSESVEGSRSASRCAYWMAAH